MDRGLKIGLIVGGIILGLLLVVPYLGGGAGMGWGMMGPGMMGGFGMGFGAIFMVLFWGLIIWGIVALVRRAASPGSDSTHYRVDSPLDVLKKRYARGDIRREEYEAMRGDMA